VVTRTSLNGSTNNTDKEKYCLIQYAPYKGLYEPQIRLQICYKRNFYNEVKEGISYLRMPSMKSLILSEQPTSTLMICGWLGLENKWEYQSVAAGYQLPEIDILFQRIDKKVIEIETGKLTH